MKRIVPIWSYFDPQQRSMLEKVAAPVELSQVATPEFQRLIESMIMTMRHADGVGLAAPQVGQSLRLAIVMRLDDPRAEPYVLVNPVVSPQGTQQELGEEGCLSIPKVYGLVPRFHSIRLTAFDRHGQPWSMNATDMTARIIQHEVDHLDGRLFITRATTITAGAELLP